MSCKCLSHSVAFHFVFNLVRQPPAIVSSLLFLPDQAERGCGLNMSSHQQATSNLPPFDSMVPINTLLPPCREATDSEGDRRGPGVMEIWSVWKRNRERGRGRETEIEAENERKQEGSSLLSILNLPQCWRSPAVFNSCSVKRSVPLLSPDAYAHTQRYSKLFDITAAFQTVTKITLKFKSKYEFPGYLHDKNCSTS